MPSVYFMYCCGIILLHSIITMDINTFDEQSVSNNKVVICNKCSLKCCAAHGTRQYYIVDCNIIH